LQKNSLLRLILGSTALHSLLKNSRMNASPWKSGPSGPRERPEISAGFGTGGRSPSADCVFPQPVQRRGYRSVLSTALAAEAALLLALLFSAYAQADAGAETYKTKCAACHGANGTGETMLGKNLKLRSFASSEVQKQSDDELAAIIRKGKNRMPPYDRKLSKDQIRDLVREIRSLKK
jgi:cytochrome c551